MPDLPKAVFSSEKGGFTPFFNSDTRIEVFEVPPYETQPVNQYPTVSFQRQVPVNRGCDVAFAADITTGLYYLDVEKEVINSQFIWNDNDQGWNIGPMNLVFSLQGQPVIKLPIAIEGLNDAGAGSTIVPFGAIPLNLSNGTDLNPYYANGVQVGGFSYFRSFPLNDNQGQPVPLKETVCFMYPSWFYNTGGFPYQGSLGGNSVYNFRALERANFEFDTLTLNGSMIQQNNSADTPGKLWSIGIGLIAMSI